jgi:glc operon protein GlcG
MLIHSTLVLAALNLLPAASATAQSVTGRPGLTLEGARAVIAAAAAEARRAGAGGAIAVVDEGGNLVALERLDGTFAAAGPVSIGKARTSAIFQKPTRFFEDLIRNGRTPMLALDDFTPLQGGVPIVVDGHVVGAVGVSGARSAQHDDDLAVIGAAAISSPSLGAMSTPLEHTHLRSADVTAAFAKGMPLVETPAYKVHASRRAQPGTAEVHARDTDIFYVLEGSATVVLGGTVVGATETGADEVRGSAIEGGQVHRIGKGDVLIVPRGMPHWFKEVQGPVLYYVVKVTE